MKLENRSVMSSFLSQTKPLPFMRTCCQFRFSGLLYGDGVCHLASLINWVAKDAGLEVQAPVSHDFREIPEIPKEFGTSIYFYPGQKATNAQQNLYITNNLKNPVAFKVHYDGEKLKIEVFEEK
ncbi:MAG: VanW family protein [Candidatus Levybacteria bacterium]|nr:VanW family protein [Candidatus Levybacteria bacterium]